MPVPETRAEKEKISLLQDELQTRGVVLPKSVLPCLNEEAALLRFLKARKFDIAAAADQLETSMQWRQENNVEEYMSQFLPNSMDQVIRRCMPTGWLGYDKLGLPVWMEHPAAMDVAGMEAAGVTMDDICFYQVRSMEPLGKELVHADGEVVQYMIQCKFAEASKHAGRLVDTHTVILDVGGLRMGLMNRQTINIFRAISILYQAHYPELMTRMFIVNIPLIFGAMWRVASMIIDDRVKAKIRFLKKSEMGQLYEFIDRDQLPTSLGGTREGCLSTHTGFIPDSLQAVDAEIRRRQQAAKSADEAVEASLTAAPEGPPTPPPIGETPSTRGLLQRVSMRFRKPSLTQTPQSRVASGSSQRDSLADPQPPADPCAAPPPEGPSPSAHPLPLKPALPAGVVQAVHRLDHQPQVPEQTLLRNSIAPHIPRPSHLATGSRQPSGSGSHLGTPSTMGAHQHAGHGFSGASKLVRSSVALANQEHPGSRGSSGAAAHVAAHALPVPSQPLGSSSIPPGPPGSHHIAPRDPDMLDLPSSLDGGLLDADQLDALGTLRRTDSAPNLGEQERLPFRQRRAVKKAAKAGRKQEKADRKAERKAHKVRVHRRFLCCSVPLTVHEDEADGLDAPSDSAVSIAQGLRRASQASQASSLDEPVHADGHRGHRLAVAQALRMGRSPSMPNMKILDTGPGPGKASAAVQPLPPAAPRRHSALPAPVPARYSGTAMPPLPGLSNIAESRESMRSRVSMQSTGSEDPLVAPPVAVHAAQPDSPAPLSARMVHDNGPSLAHTPAAGQVDIAQLSTYQPRFEPAVLATSHPRPKPLEASGIPRSPPASPQRDPPRLWEVHRQPAGCYQWLGDRIKAVLLVLAILGLVVQLFTLQPYHGPGVSPFAPRHVKQAHQPLLQQGSYNIASRVQDTGSSLAGSALLAAEQAQQAAASAGGTVAGSVVGAAQGLQQRGSASAQKLRAAATGENGAAVGSIQRAGSSAAGLAGQAAHQAQEAAAAAASLTVGAALGLQQRASDPAAHASAAVEQAAGSLTEGAGGLAADAQQGLVNSLAAAGSAAGKAATGVSGSVGSTASAAGGVMSDIQQKAAATLHESFAPPPPPSTAQTASDGLAAAADAVRGALAPPPPPTWRDRLWGRKKAKPSLLGKLTGVGQSVKGSAVHASHATQQAGAAALAAAAGTASGLQQQAADAAHAAADSASASLSSLQPSTAAAASGIQQQASAAAATAGGAAAVALSSVQESASHTAQAAAGQASDLQQAAAEGLTSLRDGTAHAAQTTLDRAAGLQQQAATAMRERFGPSPPPTALQAAADRLQAAAGSVASQLTPPPPPSVVQQAAQAVAGRAGGLQQAAADTAAAVRDSTAQTAQATWDVAATLQQQSSPPSPPTALQAAAGKLQGASDAMLGAFTPPPPPSVLQQAAQSVSSTASQLHSQAGTLLSSPPGPSIGQQAAETARSAAGAVQQAAQNALSPPPGPTIGQQAAAAARSAAGAVQNAAGVVQDAAGRAVSPPPPASWWERLRGKQQVTPSLTQRLPELSSTKLQEAMAHAGQALGEASEAVKDTVARQDAGAVAANMMGQMKQALGATPDPEPSPSSRFSRFWRR